LQPWCSPSNAPAAQCAGRLSTAHPAARGRSAQTHAWTNTAQRVKHVNGLGSKWGAVLPASEPCDHAAHRMFLSQEFGPRCKSSASSRGQPLWMRLDQHTLHCQPLMIFEAFSARS